MKRRATKWMLVLGFLHALPQLSIAEDDDAKKRAPAGENRDAPPLPASFPLRPEKNLDPSEEGIARELKRLGSDDSDAREDASDRLFWIGEPARPGLEGALKSEDAEVVAQARRVLALLDARRSLHPRDSAEPAGGSAVVGSEKRDPEALGGWYKSPNMPVPIPARVKAPEGKVSIVVAGDSVAVWQERTLGRIVHIVNRTGSEAAFAGCDSRLRLFLEAKNEAGEWQAIESEGGSFCGNSYHRAFLPAGKMWSFTAPVYAGTHKTKLRYRLFPGQQNEEGAIVSEEFEGAVNPALFKAGAAEKD